ncbi:MAG TPA: hypothetical protein VMT58_01755 [Candidatus Binataceae bacterium]|nr:hypothetical protein [Candidatus Binataceae bacterium]
MRKVFSVAAWVGLVAFAGCASTQTSRFDDDLSTIRSGYHECVNDLGAESPACKSLADGVHQVAEQVGGGMNTAAAIKAESAARQSLGR